MMPPAALLRFACACACLGCCRSAAALYAISKVWQQRLPRDCCFFWQLQRPGSSEASQLHGSACWVLTFSWPPHFSGRLTFLLVFCGAFMHCRLCPPCCRAPVGSCCTSQTGLQRHMQARTPTRTQPACIQHMHMHQAACFRFLRLLADCGGHAYEVCQHWIRVEAPPVCAAGWRAAVLQGGCCSLQVFALGARCKRLLWGSLWGLLVGGVTSWVLLAGRCSSRGL